MKYRSFAMLCVAACLANACHKEKHEPKPADSSATYAEGAGAPVAIALPPMRLLTVASDPATNSARRALVFDVTLPNGSFRTLYFSYIGSQFPAVGPVALDVPVQIATSTSLNGPFYQDGTSGASLRVTGAAPKLVSATYAGYLSANGPAATLTFTNLPL